MSNQCSIRVFNDEGLNEFERSINEIRNSEAKNISDDLLVNENYSSVFEPIINIEKVDYKNKNELVPYIVDALDLKVNKHLYFNKGLWSWLAAFYFDNICPEDGNGKRKVNENAFYILRDPKNYTKYYRHL